MNRLFLSVICSSALSATAATYFVDYVGGSDANAGTSTGAPWKHSHFDANATGVALSTAIMPGDTIRFKGGVSYVGMLVLTNGGSAGSQLTFDGNTAGTWGTGQAVFDGNYVFGGFGILAGSSGIGFVNVSNIVFQHFAGYAPDSAEVVNAAAGTLTNTASTFGVGVQFYEGRHTNLVIANCIFREIGGWRNTQGWTIPTIEGCGVRVRDVDGVSIINCEVTKGKIGFAVYATTVARNVEIVGCDLHDFIVWGVDVAPQVSGAVLENISIHRNRIRDYAQFNNGNWTGNGEWPHTDGVFLRKASTPSVWTNVRVFDNVFSCDNPANSLGGTASIYVSQGASALIYNNLFASDSQTRIIGVEHGNAGSEEQFVLIANNTFIGSQPAVSFADEEDPAKRRVVFVNNLMLRPSGGAANHIFVHRLSGVLPEVMDYNLYFDPDWGIGSKFVVALPAYTLMGNLPTWYGVETHGLYANPQLVNASGTPSAMNFRPLAGSPVIGAGTNLSAYFTTDRTGRQRTRWDIGAHEFGAPARATVAYISNATFGTE